MDNLLTLLQGTGYQFALWAWDKAPTGDYGVLSIESGNDFMADGKHLERGTACIVDLFTRVASAVPRDAIENVLQGYPYELRSVQYEDDTGYIHYEWSVSIYG